MQTSKHIATWLTLGPIYNPGHQTDQHAPGDGHPRAADIVQDIDRQVLAPTMLTGLLEMAPSAGDSVSYGDDQLFPARTYVWRELSFAEVDWGNIREVHDAIHTRLGAGILSGNPDDPDSFAGKHHALVFFLVYVVAPEAGTTHLCIRSDDAVRVWLDGGEIMPLRYVGERDIDAQSPESCTEIQLRQGVNILLAAVAETHVEWGFSARFENDENLIFLTRKPDICTVRGTVADSQGNPVDNLLVRAFDKDLRHEQWLGAAATDSTGRYTINYFQAQFRRTEKESADLVVRVLGPDGGIFVESPIVFNPQPMQVVDLTIPAGKQRPLTLFERIGQDVRPVLDGVRLKDLEEDSQHQDISFLSGETSFEKPALARFVLAHKLVKPGLGAEFWFAILGGSFFSYDDRQSLKEQSVTIREGLPSLDALALGKSLNRAFNQQEIPATLRRKSDVWIDTFLKLVAMLLAKGETGDIFVKSALEEAGIASVDKQKAFALLLNKHRRLSPELLAALKQDAVLDQGEIADLTTSLRLSELTRADFSVVRQLKADFGIRRPEEIRKLAKRSESEWVRWVALKHAEGAITLPLEAGAVADQMNLPVTEVSGKMLARQFREAFPTAAFAGGLERTLQNGGARGLRRAKDVSRFLERHENFELLNTSIDEFLKDSLQPDLAKDESFTRELKAIQRIFKLVPSFEATDNLLADDLHSAQKIYRLGESEFVRRYENSPGFTKQIARTAWNRAADTHAAVLTLVGDLKALDTGNLPGRPDGIQTSLAKFPNWNNLFETGDLCECAHCRSVLSPAAYFADILMFLRDRNSTKSKPGGYFSTRDILFDRRPDLGWLELNCANALTTLPYIDVVCEVLEAAVDREGENDLELPGFTVMPADLATAKVNLAQAFTEAFADDLINQGKEKIALGANFSLSQVDPADPDRWVVHGDKASYLLKKKTTSPNFFAGIVCNAKAGAAELRAYPQYVNPKVYKKLSEEKYPIPLPFDLFAEEVRAAFRKTNLQRWDLMRTCRGFADPDNPTDGEIAAEYFGISADPDAAFDEKLLILDADPTIAGQKAVWGESSAGWLNRVSIVRNFLQKTSLEYNELLALLDLRFINPTGDVGIAHLNASCDTDKKTIRNLDATKLDRIHRFLRLFRKLKDWKMWELDLVIRHPSIGNQSLGEDFLIKLFHFCELRKKLGARATVEQICALFGNLNTGTRFTKLHETREEALYQNLFLNKRLVNPLDPAFQLDPVTGDLPDGEIIAGHQAVILSALGIREADLVLLINTNDALTLANLSFLWRHAWLSKAIKFKAEEWKIVLKLFSQDEPEFAGPTEALAFLEKIDQIKACGLTPDELNWLLAADRTAKAATKEAASARFLSTLRKELQAIKDEHAPAQYDYLTVSPVTDVDSLTALLTSLLQRLNRDEGEIQAFLNIVSRGEHISGTPEELLVKFYEPKFSAPLRSLPELVDFASQLSDTLAKKISYDSEQRLLHFTGIMGEAEKTEFQNLSDEPAYLAAIENLATQPQASNAPDARIWLTDADLDADQPNNDSHAKRLAKAAGKGLNYLSQTLTENIIIQLSSSHLGLSEALTRRLLAEFPIMPESLLAHLSGDFALQANTLNGWYWAERVAALLKKWKIALVEMEQLVALAAAAQLIDFKSLPLDDTQPIASLECFLRTSRLLRLRDSLPETNITLLEVLEKLSRGAYANEAETSAPTTEQQLFATDVWPTTTADIDGKRARISW